MKAQFNQISSRRLSYMILVVAVTINFVGQNVQSAALKKNMGDDEIFNRYKPLAMDESWTVVKKPLTGGELGEGSELVRKDKKLLMDLDDDIIKSPMNLPDLDEQVPYFKGDLDNPPSLSQPKSLGLLDVEDGIKRNVSVKDNLFLLPKNETSSLTKLISGKETPTFVHNAVVAPTSIQKGKGKVLATYKILIPIYIPALKRTPKVNTRGLMNGVNYTTETKVNMVPVKKNVVRTNTVIKAEPVPQRVITDFVKSEGNSVPSSVDDKLKPNEKVLKSVVTDF